VIDVATAGATSTQQSKQSNKAGSLNRAKTVQLGSIPPPATDPAVITKAFHQLIGKKRSYSEHELGDHDFLNEDGYGSSGDMLSEQQMVDGGDFRGGSHSSNLPL